MQTVEMRKNPETCDEAMDIMGYIDITDFVKDEGYGMYYCVNIPFVYGYSYDDVIYHGYLEYDRYASWDIVVVEEDDTLPIRELNLKIGLANTRSTEAEPKEYNIKIGNNGVKSKSQGQVNGQILYALDGVDRTPGNVKQEIKLNEITDSGEKKI